MSGITHGKLLEKFPPFDAAWEKEVQRSWWGCFEAFTDFFLKYQQDIAAVQEAEYRLAVERYTSAKLAYGAMIHEDTRPKAAEFGVAPDVAERIDREVEREWNRRII